MKLDGKQPISHGKQNISNGKQPIFHGKQTVSHDKQPVFHGKQTVFHAKQPVFQLFTQFVQRNNLKFHIECIIHHKQPNKTDYLHLGCQT